jgi:hypothetical protein
VVGFSEQRRKKVEDVAGVARVARDESIAIYLKAGEPRRELC